MPDTIRCARYQSANVFDANSSQIQHLL